MSSAAYLGWDPGEGPTTADWETFARAHGVAYSPRTSGGNVWYAGDVEVHVQIGGGPDHPDRITFSTFHAGPAMPDVARLALALWKAHGGKLAADPEIRHYLFGADHSEYQVNWTSVDVITACPTYEAMLEVAAENRFTGARPEWRQVTDWMPVDPPAAP